MQGIQVRGYRYRSKPKGGPRRPMIRGLVKSGKVLAPKNKCFKALILLIGSDSKRRSRSSLRKAWWEMESHFPSFLEGALAFFYERKLFLTLVSSTRAQKAGRSGISYPFAVFERRDSAFRALLSFRHPVIFRSQAF